MLVIALNAMQERTKMPQGLQSVNSVPWERTKATLVVTSACHAMSDQKVLRWDHPHALHVPQEPLKIRQALMLASAAKTVNLKINPVNLHARLVQTVPINHIASIARQILRVAVSHVHCVQTRMRLEWAAKAPHRACLLYTSPSPRDYAASRMPSSA